MQKIFDRNILRMHRDRASSTLKKSDFLIQHSLNTLLDRAYVCKSKYDMVLNLGARTFDVSMYREKVKIHNLVNSDLSMKMLSKLSGHKVQADEEFMPFLDRSFELILSNLNLHWINDLPGALVQVYRALKKDGLFIASFIGENSLHELKSVLLNTETDLSKPIHFHVSPTVTSELASALFVRAGFKEVVVDKESIVVTYSDPLKIMEDLKNMGESNCMGEGKLRCLDREVLQKFSENYRRMFGDNKGDVQCSFDVITCVGCR